VLQHFPSVCKFEKPIQEDKVVQILQIELQLARGWLLDLIKLLSTERERFTSSPTFLCGNTPATLG